MECEDHDLIVEGEIPLIYVAHCIAQVPTSAGSSRAAITTCLWGDGMVHAFHIGGGKVNYNNTAGCVREVQAMRQSGTLADQSDEPFDCDPSTATSYSPTRMARRTGGRWHGGRMLVMEEGHPPL